MPPLLLRQPFSNLCTSSLPCITSLSGCLLGKFPVLGRTVQCLVCDLIVRALDQATGNVGSNPLRVKGGQNLPCLLPRQVLWPGLKGRSPPPFCFWQVGTGRRFLMCASFGHLAVSNINSYTFLFSVEGFAVVRGRHLATWSSAGCLA